MTTCFGIFGAGGLGREIAHVIAQLQPDRHLGDDFVFVDKNDRSNIDGLRCLSEQEFLNQQAELQFVIAIADNKIRQSLFEKLCIAGAVPKSIFSKSSEVIDHSRIGPASICCNQSIISTNVKAGKGLILNVQTYIAHDCEIGDFVTIGPNTVCAGNVIVGDNVYIGGGVSIKQGSVANPIKIGKGAIVGMGSVVTKSVEPYTVVAGNPARVVSKK